MRSRTLLATLIAVLAAAAPAAAQTPEPPTLEAAYEYAGSVLASFRESSTSGLGFGPATFASGVEVAPGVTRTVGAFAAGEPYRYDAGVSQSEWAVAMVFRLDDVSGRRRVLNVQNPTDPNALYVEDGRLVYERGASDAAGAAGTVAAGEWVHVVVARRSSDDVRVYVDGVPDIAFSDAANDAILISHGEPGFPGLGYRFRLFDGVGAEGASGQLARLRTFEGEMDDASALGLRALDTRTPEVTFPSETAVDGAFWLSRTDTLYSEIVDEASSARIESWLEDADGTEVTGTRAVKARSVEGAHGEGVERVRTYHSFGAYPALQDGERYDLVVVAEDASGNESAPQRFPIAADLSAPASLTIDGPGARTADRSPLVSGTAAMGAGDDPAVYGQLCKGTSCESTITRGWGSSPVIGDFEATISGGKWSAEARMDNPDPDGDPDLLFDLPNGTYTVEVWFCDHVSNCLSRTRTFEVTDPAKPAPVEEQGGEQQAPAPPAPPAPSSQSAAPRTAAPGPALPAARDVAAQLSRAAVSGLTRARLKGLLRGASLGLRPARPGAVSVQVLDAAKKRVLARGTGAGTLKVRPTGPGRAKLRRPKRLTVVVRTTFTPAGGAPVRVDRRVTLKR